MSMPRVGSSSSSTFGSAASHLASDDLLLIAAAEIADALVQRRCFHRSRSTNVPTSSRSRAGRNRPNRVARCKHGRLTFSATLIESTRPSALRSSGASAIPAPIASRGRANRHRLAGDDESSPVDVCGCSPKMVCSSSVRPAPISPNRPSTSPRRTANETSRTAKSPARSG